MPTIIKILHRDQDDDHRLHYMKGIRIMYGRIRDIVDEAAARDPPEDPSSINVDSAIDKAIQEYRDWLYNIMQVNPPIPFFLAKEILRIPPETIKTEILEVIRDPRSDYERGVKMMGLELWPEVCVLFAAATDHRNERYNGALARWLQRVVARQPRRWHVGPENELFVITTENIFPCLGQLIAEIGSGRGGAESDQAAEDVAFVLQDFVSTVTHICDFHQQTEYRYNEHSAELWEALSKLIVDEYEVRLSDPFSAGSLYVRRELMRIPFERWMNEIYAMARRFTTMYPPNQLGWRMHRWLIQTARGFGWQELVSKAIDILPALASVGADPEDRPRINYRPDVGTIPNDAVQTVLQWLREEYDNDNDNESVQFEAVGPELDIADFAKPRLAISGDESCAICLEKFVMYPNPKTPEGVMELRCGHIFHRGCMNEVINGIEKSSCRCPLCREKICPERARRPILDDPEDEVIHRNGVAAEDVVIDRREWVNEWIDPMEVDVEHGMEEGENFFIGEWQ